MPYELPFALEEADSSIVRGVVNLADPQTDAQGNQYRLGRVSKLAGGSVDVVLYHNPHTREFLYLRDGVMTPALARLCELEEGIYSPGMGLRLPGQLCLGAERTLLVGRAVEDIVRSAPLLDLLHGCRQEQIAVFPIAREGLKYQVAEGLFQVLGVHCDEVLLDAHHVFDKTVPVYNRKVEMTLFKDKDLDSEQKRNMRVAIIADSIASGLVMQEVIRAIHQRFEQIEHIELVAPLATVRGLCRIIQAHEGEDFPPIRVHIFETLLNALAPDYYYSAHYPQNEMHIQPGLEEDYRAWWGRDDAGNWIADTACAGYGWSESFFSPRRQIQMMNAELTMRHGLTIAQILKRNILI